MNGLAAAMAQVPQGVVDLAAVMPAEPNVTQQSAGRPASPMRDVEQIAQLLAQGMSPEELVAQGIPVELVQMALDMLTQQVTEVPDEQAGLAGMYNKGGM